jgi:NAD(P)-dependent dehydrogenase (short-subunit alcohol dehydrogenase family)
MNMMRTLDGCIAIVTGAGGPWIGHSISMELACAGATVAIAEIDLPAGEHVQAQIKNLGGKADVHRADVSKAKDVQAMIEQVVRDHGRVDILINNAGVGLIRPVVESTEEEFDRLSESISGACGYAANSQFPTCNAKSREQS